MGKMAPSAAALHPALSLRGFFRSRTASRTPSASMSSPPPKVSDMPRESSDTRHSKMARIRIRMSLRNVIRRKKDLDEARVGRLLPSRSSRSVRKAKARLRQAMRRYVVRRRLSQQSVVVSKLPNKNRPADYSWMRELLVRIVQCRAPPVHDAATGMAGTPLFVVAGACPSILAGMQSVMFAAMHAADDAAPPTVDFWWIKPRSNDPNELEPQTMSRNTRGIHKNIPGRSASLYAPIGAAIQNGASTGGAIDDSAGEDAPCFGLERVEGFGWRATLRRGSEPGVTRYLVLVWQELWSSPLARSKWIEGKLLYQRQDSASLMDSSLFAAPYRFDGKAIAVALEAEEPVPSVLPPDSFKLGCRMPSLARNLGRELQAASPMGGRRSPARSPARPTKGDQQAADGNTFGLPQVV